MSKLFNISKEQFEEMQAAAEKQAQDIMRFAMCLVAKEEAEGIMKSRNAAIRAARAAAETEAQDILKSRYSAVRAARSAAEAEAQDILKSRNAAIKTEKKRKQQAKTPPKEC